MCFHHRRTNALGKYSSDTNGLVVKGDISDLSTRPIENTAARMADDDLTPLVSALDIKPTTRYGRPPRMPHAFGRPPTIAGVDPVVCRCRR
jgi:hypothetical protein